MIHAVVMIGRLVREREKNGNGIGRYGWLYLEVMIISLPINFSLYLDTTQTVIIGNASFCCLSISFLLLPNHTVSQKLQLTLILNFY